MRLSSAVLALLTFGPALLGAPRSEVRVGSERRVLFNDGWRFFKGEAPGAEQLGFADSSWRVVQLPHDWAIEEPFDRNLNPHTGALPFFGTGWYRITVHLPRSAKRKHFLIEVPTGM